MKTRLVLPALCPRLANTAARALLLFVCLRGISLLAQPSPPENLRIAMEGITSENLLNHVKILASDAYEGRGPGGRGEDLTVQYLIRQFQQIGLQPGNPNGTWTQEVPLVGIQSESAAELELEGKKRAITYPQDYVAWTSRPEPEVAVTDSGLVFVGYGVQAPEYRWDDYKGADLKGRALVILVNDPQIPHPEDPSRLDPRYFKGKEMTYYGRWTYKLEMAAKQGAAAVVLIHETGPAGYPYFVVVNSWGRENFTLKTAAGSNKDVPIASWFSRQRARALFDELGFDFDELKQRALRPDFAPIPLKAKVSFRLKNQTREIASKNVIAKIQGAEQKRRDECLVITAHWDHLGVNKNLEGDQIFNGALDNATGIAGLLELAKTFVKLRPPTARSVFFLATAAEEQGLLGAEHYVENPFVPMNKTLANFNLDCLNQWGATRDVTVIGYGASSLDTFVEQAAKTQNRVVKGDPEPEKGSYYRSDHFQFAKKGVPALYLRSGIEYIGRPTDYGLRKSAEYRNNDYHKVSDEIKADWNLAGAVQDLQLLAQVIYQVSQENQWPRWRPGNEFLHIRNQSLGQTPR